MNANVNIEEVKKYNATLKQYKESAAQLQAQKDYISKDIDAKCAELSKELGIEVNRDNLEQVCKDLCDKINTTLASGNAVLNKIAAEKNAQAQAQVQGQQNAGVGTSAVNTQPVQFNQQVPVAPSIPTPPPMPMGVNTSQIQGQGQGQVVDNGVVTDNAPGNPINSGFGTVDGNTLPPLFGI